MPLDAKHGTWLDASHERTTCSVAKGNAWVSFSEDDGRIANVTEQCVVCFAEPRRSGPLISRGSLDYRSLRSRSVVSFRRERPH